jgi:hypothetical protein
MTILWEFNEKHPKQVSAYGLRPVFFVGNYAPAITIARNKSASGLSLCQDADPGGEHHQGDP